MDLIWLGVILLIISIVAYVLGAQGIAGFTASIGRTILIIGVVLAVIVFIYRFLVQAT